MVGLRFTESLAVARRWMKFEVERQKTKSGQQADLKRRIDALSHFPVKWLSQAPASHWRLLGTGGLMAKSQTLSRREVSAEQGHISDSKAYVGAQMRAMCCAVAQRKGVVRLNLDASDWLR